nr:MAG TPA: hypothetical protein [Caudoviricetes sp.]
MNKYPYTNYQDLNLDWVIKVVTDMDGAGAKAAKEATDAATAAEASATDANNSRTAAGQSATAAQSAAIGATNDAANASVSAATARNQASAAEASAARAEAAAKSTAGFVWRGDWKPNVTYNKNNLVFSRPSTFICKTDGTIGEVPDLDPANWDLFCEGTLSK